MSCPHCRCPHSGKSVDSLRNLVDGCAPCPTCGQFIHVITHPDGGPGPFFAEHEKGPRS